MFIFPPKNLQNALIFYITCIIIFTNGFFAVVTLSRENIIFYQEALNRSIFWGTILLDPSRDFLTTGDSTALDKLFGSRPFSFGDVRITLYDRNWWKKWGDPSRIPPEGFPTSMERATVSFRSGIPGETSREIYFSVATGTKWIGTIGVGVPEFGSNKEHNAARQVVLTTFANIFLGIALAVFIAQIILRPLSMLLDGLDAIKRGDYGQRVQVQGDGELAVLGQMFNRMAASLQEKIKENLDRNRILDEKVQELWEIYELTKAMGFSLHLQQILERFLEKAQTLSFSSYGQILLNIPESKLLEVRVKTPTFPVISQGGYEESLKKCLEAGETFETKSENHTLLFIPLMSGRLVQGVLFLGKQGEQSYSDGIRRFLETIAPLGGSLIENARLYQHVVEMKDYVRNVLDSVDSGVATIDREGRIVTANSAFVQLFGNGELRPDGIKVNEFLKPLNNVAFAEAFEKIAMGRASKPGNSGVSSGIHRHELFLTLPDGENRIFQIRVSRLMGRENILGRVIIVDDMTSLKQIERRMFESEKWVVLGRLAASVAHEIRNPLVAIRGLVEVIGEGLTGENEQHIKVVIGEVQRLNKVVEQLLHLSRPEKTELRECSLNDLIDELIVLVRHEAARANIGLEKICPPGKVCGRIDPEKIKQAFLNVMLNGVQAMSRGGTLKITLDEQVFTRHGETPQRNIVVDFDDDGEGIQLDNLDRVFDPFFTTRPTGTGLGLAITKKILDLHEGKVEITSQIGKGTRVRIILPQNTSEDLG